MITKQELRDTNTKLELANLICEEENKAYIRINKILVCITIMSLLTTTYLIIK